MQSQVILGPMLKSLMDIEAFYSPLSDILAYDKEPYVMFCSDAAWNDVSIYVYWVTPFSDWANYSAIRYQV